jgi:hypothetical protein
MTTRLTRALVLVMALAIFPAAAAAGPRLVLDAFSFFSFEGDNATAVLPSGAEIPLELTQSSATSWTITIPQSALDVPPVRYPSGRSVRWALSAPAVGQLTVTEQGGSCRIEAPLVAHVEGADSSVPFPLTFSTETATSRGDGLVASRTGVRLDPTSGFIQLVAAGVSPAEAPTAPGKPFYAVLSGQILDLPQKLKAP